MVVEVILMVDAGLVYFARVTLWVAKDVSPAYRSKFSKHRFMQLQLFDVRSPRRGRRGKRTAAMDTANLAPDANATFFAIGSRIVANGLHGGTGLLISQ